MGVQHTNNIFSVYYHPVSGLRLPDCLELFYDRQTLLDCRSHPRLQLRRLLHHQVWIYHLVSCSVLGWRICWLEAGCLCFVERLPVGRHINIFVGGVDLAFGEWTILMKSWMRIFFLRQNLHTIRFLMFSLLKSLLTDPPILLFGMRLTIPSLTALTSILVIKHIHKLIQNLLFLWIHTHIHLLVVLLQSFFFVSSFKI